MDKNKLFWLNKKETLRRYRDEASCLFAGCALPAINSHTYPNSFLKQISEHDDLLVLNLDELYSSSERVKAGDLFVSKSPKKAAVEKLFCKLHDDSVFSPIEKNPLNTEIDTYMFLYSYRLFIHEFYLENLVKGEASVPHVHEDTNFYSQFDNGLKTCFLFQEQMASYMLDNLYPHRNTVLLKEEFDRVFRTSEAPNGEDFSKFFDLAYFRINAFPKLLLSGIKTFRMPNQNGNGDVLPMVFFLVPSPNFRESFFGIVAPKSERESFNILLSFFNEEYQKYLNSNSQTFVSSMLMMLLDASQNIVLTRSLYEQWRDDGSWLRMIQAYECLTRGDIFKEQEQEQKKEAWKLIVGMEYSAWFAN
ncbi:hypothetical protein [uncultured Mobiluncus sp.]|uniref:hypothetical protein n=1 Tax=uncultured Mobiluncus sp. TaxID=293425 RepID=UPI0027D9586E|nr:hypothetical protein [uncultured Mobiluncus sp.]